MKKVLIFILPVLIIVLCAVVLLGILNTKAQKDRLNTDLRKHTRIYAANIAPAAKYALTTQNKKLADKQTLSFQKTDSNSGCIIYNNNGQIFSATPSLGDLHGDDRSLIILEIISSKTPHGEMQSINSMEFYSYIIPLYDDGGNALGALEIITNKTFINKALFGIWKRISIVLFTMFLCICAAIFILYRRFFTLPVLKITDWFESFQKGNAGIKISNIENKDFDKLVSEVEQTALKLKVAKKSISEKASVNMTKNEIWNEEKLKNLVRAKFSGNSFFVVSNREPYMHIKEGDRFKVVKPASGVVTALDPVLRACGGIWVAQASGNADDKFVNSKNMLGVPPNDESYILKRVWLDKEEEKGFYYGFSNEGLWPLCHITHTRPVFREEDWAFYKQVNRKFADNILAELPLDASPYIFIQDYHFTLLPAMIKERRPDAAIAMFWHIPWPNSEVMSICPYLNEIIDGILGCDLIGFHTQYHCNNFLELANKFLEARVDYEKFSITRSNKETLVRAFPISVSYEKNKSNVSEFVIEKIRKDNGLYGNKVILSVERMDYTKGILEKISAIDKFFEKNPQYKEKVIFIQIASPSREAIQAYKDLKQYIDQSIESVNNKYSTDLWNPVIYFARNFSAEEILPYYELADICIVSSLHDGMNLVAKEYVSLKTDNKGILILSQFTGASKELTEALIINPYSIEDFAQTIKTAVEMNEDDMICRMSAMRKTVLENNVFKWAGDILNELTAVSKKGADIK